MSEQSFPLHPSERTAKPICDWEVNLRYDKAKRTIVGLTGECERCGGKWREDGPLRPSECREPFR